MTKPKASHQGNSLGGEGELSLSLSFLEADFDDINQEAAIREWLGLPTSKAILRLKLQPTEPVFPSLPEGGEYHIPGERLINFRAMEQLVDWALDQAAEIQVIIWKFLAAPEVSLEDTLLELKALGVIESTKVKGMKGNLTDLVRRSIPASKEELLELLQRESPSTRRPAATLRQILRRLTAKGEVVVTADDMVIPHDN